MSKLKAVENFKYSFRFNIETDKIEWEQKSEEKMIYKTLISPPKADLGYAFT